MSDDEPARSRAIPVLLTLTILFVAAAGVFGVLCTKARDQLAASCP
ncbi:hypothetical protein [Actinocrispum sp. NPDC049592]